MKKIVLRKCLATSKQFEKKDLFRIVKDKEGNVSIDLTGKANGRGAYLSKDKDAILLAKRKHLLDKALETTVKEEIYDELINLL